jgi:hypothetical protein
VASSSDIRCVVCDIGWKEKAFESPPRHAKAMNHVNFSQGKIPYFQHCNFGDPGQSWTRRVRCLSPVLPEDNNGSVQKPLGRRDYKTTLSVEPVCISLANYATFYLSTFESAP